MSDLHDRMMEWANLKCRYSVYFGIVPEWVTQIEMPTWGQINQLTIQLSKATSLSTARMLTSGRS